MEEREKERGGERKRREIDMMKKGHKKVYNGRSCSVCTSPNNNIFP